MYQELRNLSEEQGQRNTNDHQAVPDNTIQVALNDNIQSDIPLSSRTCTEDEINTNQLSAKKPDSPVFTPDTLNSFSSGINAAASLFRSIEVHNLTSTLTSSIKLTHSIDNLDGKTDIAGLSTLNSATGFYNALQMHDTGGIVTSGLGLANVVTDGMVNNAIAASAEEALELSAGEAVPFVGSALSLIQGDYMGAAIGVAAMSIPVIGWIYAAYTLITSLFGSHDDPPEPKGTAETYWDTEGHLYSAITEDDDDGGKSAKTMLDNLLTPLQNYVDSQNNLALIPQRIPTVSFFQRSYAEFILNYVDETGQQVSRHYDGQGNRLNLDGSIESTLAQDFIQHATSAVVPKWEAETILAHMNSDDGQGWREAGEGAGLPKEALDRLTQTYSVLTFELPRSDSRVHENDKESRLLDVDSDGYLERTQWITANQAMLVIDKNLDNKIGGGEFLTTDQTAEMGRARNSLQWLDSNNDHILDSRDPAFAVLKIWIDINGDAVTNNGELLSLSDTGILAIDFGCIPPAIIDREGRRYELTEQHLAADVKGIHDIQVTGGVLRDNEDGITELIAQRSHDYSDEVEHIHGGGNQLPSPQEELRMVTARQIKSAEKTLFLGGGALLIGTALGAGAANAELIQHGNDAMDSMLPSSREGNAATTEGQLNGEDIFTSNVNNHNTVDKEENNIANRPSLFSLDSHLQGNDVRGEARQNNIQLGDIDKKETHEGDKHGDESLRSESNSGDGPPIFSNPQTTDEVIASEEDQGLLIDPRLLLANDFTPNAGTVLRISSVSDAAHGQVEFTPEGLIRFIPDANFHGDASFMYTATDGYGYSAQAKAHVDIAAINDVPVAVDDGFTGYEDIQFRFTQAELLANDSDVDTVTDGDVLSIISVANALHGTASLDSNGDILFTSEENYSGQASFAYTVSDGNGSQTQANVFLAINAVNDAPIIEAIEYGRPIFGYQQTSHYDPDTAQTSYTLDAVENENAARGLMAQSQLLDGSGHSFTPDTYHNGMLRPIAFNNIDATDTYFDSESGTSSSNSVDDPARQNGRIIAYDIDSDVSGFSYSIQLGPAHGHVATNVYVPASAPSNIRPDHAQDYWVGETGAWQYFSHPGDGYNGGDPFTIGVTDAEGATGTFAVNAAHHGTSQGGGGKKPVALDLDGNGLQFANLDDSNVFFDVNGDGWREHLAWVAPSDGLLVVDTEHDQTIDKPQEISFVGYNQNAYTDLDGLKSFDTNSDGVLSKLDQRWNDFAVWQDKNTNGASDSGEVKTLNEMNIIEIDLHSDGVIKSKGDVILFGESHFVRADGSTGSVGDAMFAVRMNEKISVISDHAVLDNLSNIKTDAQVAQLTLIFNQEMVATDAQNDPLGFVAITPLETPVIPSHEETTISSSTG
jgi:hypothetical protein